MTEKQTKLITDNHNLIYSFLQTHLLNVDEYYDLGAIGLCKAAKSFVEGQTSFSTYAYRCMFNEIFCYRRKKQVATVSYQAIVDDEQQFTLESLLSSDAGIENIVIINQVIDDYMQSVNDLHKNVVVKYREGYKQNEIGDMFGISQSYASRIYSNFLEYVRRNIA